MAWIDGRFTFVNMRLLLFFDGPGIRACPDMARLPNVTAQ
jgi:hypothetical protein